MTANENLKLVAVAFENSNLAALLKASSRLGFTSFSRFLRFAANECATRHPNAENLDDGKIGKGFTCVRCAAGTPERMKIGIERRKRKARK